MFRDIEYIVNLVYMDETIGDAKDCDCVAVGALVVDHKDFIPLEGVVERAALTALSAAAKTPEQWQAFRERWDAIPEFHASHLFHAQGDFAGIDRGSCFSAMDALVRSVPHFKFRFVYSAVSKKAIRSEPMLGSANPIDVAFRMCIRGVEDLIGSEVRKAVGLTRQAQGFSFPENLCVCVFDDTTDLKLKQQLKDGYREFRHRRPWSANNGHRGWHFHDAMFFGDSKESFGIQVADACCYVLLRHLTGFKDAQSVKFFDLLKPHTICSKSEPEWSQYRRWFIAHDEPNGVSVSAKPPSAPSAPSGDQQ